MGTASLAQASPSSQAAFDAAYWASQPPAVAALQSMQVDIEAPAPTGRTDTAMALAKQGNLIDVDIMIYGWDPYLVMSEREEYGYTWVESALQPAPIIAPGVSQPGTPLYNPNNPPAGSIKVSTNIADYPPFLEPAPAPVITELVGAQIIPGINQYYAVAGDTSPAGKTFTDSRGEFEKFMSPAAGPMGLNPWFWWELDQAGGIRGQMRLFVSNIPYQTDEEGLREFFVASGFVPTEVKIILHRDTGQSRGFAFLDLEELGAQAIASMHGAKLNGRALRVREAEQKQERGLRR